jgi:hypothetical protein
MYPNDTANISDGTSNHVYSLVTLGEKGQIASERTEASAPADQPAKLTIKHKTVGTELATEAQSMIRFDRVVEDANGNQGTVSHQLTSRWPVKICTSATAQKGLNEMKAFFAVAGYQDKFYQQEP